MILNYSEDKGSSVLNIDARARAEKFFIESKKKLEQRENFQPQYKPDESAEAGKVRGRIMIVGEKDFEGVEEPPKSMMEVLQEMADAKKKIPPIYLSDSDVSKKISISRGNIKEPSLKASSMPAPGDSTDPVSGLAMIRSPVNYKIFKDSATWSAFADLHKVRVRKIDFDREDALILVSMSDFPSGIFKIVKVEKKRSQLTVKYRVDPLAISVENPDKEQDFYASIAIPKNPSGIILEQVP
ncbi:MAG: hypothetical protein HY746_01555 [Elusimicrobia bacterium]|nr:hypothetical protein [Elusimicrobiota bacterium]